MPSSVLGQKETDPRGLRGSAGSRKVPDSKSKKRRLSSPLRTTLVLLLRGLLRLLLCWHQWITSSWPLIDGYIDTLTSLMSTELTGKSSGGRRWNVAPQTLRDASSELRGSDIGRPAVADDLQEALLEGEIVPAVGASFEMARHLFTLV